MVGCYSSQSPQGISVLNKTVQLRKEHHRAKQLTLNADK
jgi:hypothetical protein